MSTVATNITIGQKTYTLQYTSNALFKLEKETGKSTRMLGLILASGRGGFADLQIILWAGLEGARIKHQLRAEPFTVEEVGDMLDDAGGNGVVWEEGHPVAGAVLEAWLTAFPKPKKREGDDTGKNDQTAASSTGTTS